MPLNSENRLVEITQGSSSVAFAYDNDGRRTTLTLPNGITMSYGYDTSSQLTGINYTLGATVLGNLAYSYDLAGRRTIVGGGFARTGVPAALTSASYNADNQQTQFGQSNLTYDANGNLTSDGTNTYTWNARNQLSAISGQVSAGFAYDAFGRRISKTIGAMSTAHLYDGVNPVEELSAGGVSASMLTGLAVDEYFQRTDTSGTFDYLTDALGSTVALAGPVGGLGAQYTYEPFGNTTSTGPASTNPFQFTGRENDATGFYFYRARYYSPALERFIGEDLIEFAGGFNLYVYAYSDPTRYRDPLGTDPVIGVTVGAIAGTLQGALGAALAGGDTKDIIVSAIVGGVVGAGVGFLDPSLGVATLAVIGGGAGALGDVAGQLIAGAGTKCKPFNIGSTVGAALGGAVAGAGGTALSLAAAGTGLSELNQAS